MRILNGMGLLVLGLFLTSPANAFGELELAEKCSAAVAAGDDAAFKAAADELLKLRHQYQGELNAAMACGGGTGQLVESGADSVSERADERMAETV